MLGTEKSWLRTFLQEQNQDPMRKYSIRNRAKA
jgi:hypothetical protein